MTVLLLRLAGPLQSWGDASRFVRRGTRTEPTKSGVIGLLAAAQGRRRTDPIEDLMHLRFGVREDQAGRLVRDFQTARSLDGSRTMPLSYRYYLADALFLAAVEADEALLEGLDEAVRRPRFPLYLGRRSCPPAGRVSLGLRHGLGVREALVQEQTWYAARWYQRRLRHSPVRLPLVRDAEPGEEGETVRDVPLSFDPERREWGWRTVVREREYAVVDNPEWVVEADVPEPGAPGGHDPLAALAEE